MRNNENRVLVIGLNGVGLMPCKPQKARKLLKAKRANVVCKHPFTIQLKYKTGCAVQPTLLGDSHCIVGVRFL